MSVLPGDCLLQNGNRPLRRLSSPMKEVILSRQSYSMHEQKDFLAISKQSPGRTGLSNETVGNGGRKMELITCQ
jgi:hypothetical protein